jgi:Tol biopolymer transport system component/predicted Ser/Thr protein kinase
MGLRIGTQLGPYEILSAIGAGGMGEVYRARDTRLERIVAVKILPDHLSDRAELRERFEREARTIASLNHPHICTLYDIGQQDGTDFLVMEYLEGETLAERLKKSPLPLDQVLRYAIEISDALDKAHRKGITHRDLKPGNIMLTKSGTKLLDFGLAKLKREVAPANVQLSQVPTANDPLTAQGTRVGTLQYMSPEQLEGKEVDARTDIFAFGAVVYEMATGKKAFEGKSQASLIAKILDSDPPPMSSLHPMTPPALDRVVKKCLAKESDDRWFAAKDLCDELKWIAESSQVTLTTTAGAKGIRVVGRRELMLSAGTLLLVAIVTGLAIWNLKPAPAPVPQSVTRTIINLPLGQQLVGFDVGPAVVLSPDGTHLAYVASQGGTQQVYLSPMDRLEAWPIPGTEGATEPFFSPNGQWLGFFAGGKLKKILVSGGEGLSLADVSTPRGASWDSRGMIAFSTSNATALQLMSDAGVPPHPLTRPEKGEVSQRWPDFLPGGTAVLFAGKSIAQPSIAVYSTATGEERNLVQGGTQPRYAGSGHLVYAQGGSLMAAPFDPRRLALTGTAVPILEGVVQSAVSGDAQYSFSTNGTLVYVPGGVQSAQRRLVLVSRNGAEQLLAAPSHAYDTPRISPDGHQVAVSSEGQIWSYDISRQTLTRFTFEGKTNNRPVWTPDGKRIAFYSDKEGSLNIFWQLADGSGGLERLTTSETVNVPESFSPDGRVLAFHEADPTTGRNDIWVLQMSDRKAQPFLKTYFNQGNPRFSPDGHWLAYTSDESGQIEVYMEPYPGPGGKWQISTEGGREPVWNPNGRELFYRSGNKMMAVDVATQPKLTVGNPRMVFQGEYVSATNQFSNYDISPDGQRFLMLKPTEQVQAAPTQINVVLNWFEELKQKVPTGKK